MPIPRNNLIHDQYMDETRRFMRMFGYDPRLPRPLVNPIDMPQQPQNHPQQPQNHPQHPQNHPRHPQNHPRHPHNIRDPPTRRNNGGKTRRNNGGKTRKRKSRKNKK